MAMPVLRSRLRRAEVWIGVLTAAASTVVFSAALRWPYFADDWVYMEVTAKPGWWHGSRVWAFGGILFRPVLYLYLGFAYLAFGRHALPVHVVTFLLVLIEAVLVHRLAVSLGLRAGALLAAVMVALNPVAVIPVAWASAVSSPMALDLTLGAIILLLPESPSKRRYLVATVMYTVALLTREVVIGAALVVLLARLAAPTASRRLSRRHLILSARPALALVAVDVVYLAVRLAGGYPGHGPDPYRQTVGLHAARYLGRLAEWSAFVVIPHHPALDVIWTVVFWATLLVGSAWLTRRGSLVAASGVAWAVIGFGPVVFIVVQPLAYYYVDFAVPGVALAAGALSEPVLDLLERRWGEKGWRRSARVLGVSGVVALACISFFVSRAELSAELDHAPALMTRLEEAPLPRGPGDRACLPRSYVFLTGDGAMYQVLEHDPALVVDPC